MHHNRVTRNRTKRALKQRCAHKRPPRSTDGPECPYCEPHVNGGLKRATELGRQHDREIREALSV